MSIHRLSEGTIAHEDSHLPQLHACTSVSPFFHAGYATIQPLPTRFLCLEFDRPIRVFAVHGQITSRHQIDRVSEVRSLFDVATIGRSFHMLRQGRRGFEDLQACGTSMVSTLVGRGLEVCCEGLGIRKALAVQALGRLDVKGGQKLTCTSGMDT